MDLVKINKKQMSALLGRIGSYNKAANLIGVNRSTLMRYCTGAIKSISRDKLEKLKACL